MYSLPPKQDELITTLTKSMITVRLKMEIMSPEQLAITYPQEEFSHR